MPRRAFIASIIKVSGNVNADMGIGTRIPLKKIITVNQETKAFVSARCIRRCIRERLSEKGLPIDPLQLVGMRERQLGDIGDPIEYVDDDLFGYLIPTEPPVKRASPVKVSHLISLRHTEIKPEFAARFARDFLSQFEKGYPVPFEIEVAEWLGKLEVIISDRISHFEKDELTKEVLERHKEKLEEIRGGVYRLKKDINELYNSRKRLEALLEVLLWEGWQFPRSAQSPSIPEFYYSVIALTDRFIPMFSYIDVDKNDTLSKDKLDKMKNLYEPLIKSLIIVDYRDGKYQIFKKSKDENEGFDESNEDELDYSNIKEKILKEICDYIIHE